MYQSMTVSVPSFGPVDSKLVMRLIERDPNSTESTVYCTIRRSGVLRTLEFPGRDPPMATFTQYS